MGFKEDLKKPGTYVAWYNKRHPITRESVGLRRIGLVTRAEAKRVEAELILKVEEKIHRSKVPTWVQLVDQYIQWMKDQGLSGKTINTYDMCLKAHTLGDWGNRTIDLISSQDIRELITQKLGQKSPSHQKNLLKFIRGCFSYALEKGSIQRNPAPKMKFRLGDKIKRVLTKTQVEFFLNKAKQYECEWYPHWCLALYTGMRNGELYALTWDKVSIENRQILVDSAWNNVDGFKSTKSGDDRIVEIAPTLTVLLKELKLQSSDSPFVLPRIDKWDKGEQARELRLFLAGIGLERIRFHDLRATWATIMLSKGVEPIKVMKMGGWKDIKTMQIYVRKAGVDIQGITNDLCLHNPNHFVSEVIPFSK